jgi:hypothetical protein
VSRFEVTPCEAAVSFPSKATSLHPHESAVLCTKFIWQSPSRPHQTPFSVLAGIVRQHLELLESSSSCYLTSLDISLSIVLLTQAYFPATYLFHVISQVLPEQQTNQNRDSGQREESTD